MSINQTVSQNWLDSAREIPMTDPPDYGTDEAWEDPGRPLLPPVSNETQPFTEPVGPLRSPDSVVPKTHQSDAGMALDWGLTTSVALREELRRNQAPTPTRLGWILQQLHHETFQPHHPGPKKSTKRYAFPRRGPGACRCVRLPRYGPRK